MRTCQAYVVDTWVSTTPAHALIVGGAPAAIAIGSHRTKKLTNVVRFIQIDCSPGALPTGKQTGSRTFVNLRLRRICNRRSAPIEKYGPPYHSHLMKNIECLYEGIEDESSR